MQRFSEFKGLKNTAREDTLEVGDLTSATNVDIDTSGHIQARAGHINLDPTPSHSLWSGVTGTYVVQGTSLYKLDPELRKSEVATGITGRVSYVEIDDKLFWADGHKVGVVSPYYNGLCGLAPATGFSASSSSSGELPIGEYQVAVALVRVDGFESGLSASVPCTLSGVGGLQVSVSSDNPDVVGMHVYISSAGGGMLYDAELASVGTFNAYSLPSSLPAPDTVGVSPPPANSSILFQFASRLWAVAGQFIFYSLPFNYESFNLAYNYIAIDGNVVMTCPTDEGIFVATKDRTYFISGLNPTEMKLNEVAPFGAVKNTACLVPSEHLDGELTGAIYMWTSSKGFCIGLPNGEVRNMTGDRYVPIVKNRGAAAFRLNRGVPQYIVST